MDFTSQYTTVRTAAVGLVPQTESMRDYIEQCLTELKKTIELWKKDELESQSEYVYSKTVEGIDGDRYTIVTNLVTAPNTERSKAGEVRIQYQPNKNNNSPGLAYLLLYALNFEGFDLEELIAHEVAHIFDPKVNQSKSTKGWKNPIQKYDDKVESYGWKGQILEGAALIALVAALPPMLSWIPMLFGFRNVFTRVLPKVFLRIQSRRRSSTSKSVS